MKKVIACFLVVGTMSMMMYSCKQTTSSRTSVVSSEADEESIAKSVSESVSSTNNYDLLVRYEDFRNGYIDVPVTLTPEVTIDDIYLEGYHLTFNYEVGELQGTANIRLGYGSYREYIAPEDRKEENFPVSMSFEFHYDGGETSLIVNWNGSGYEMTDTYKLDKTTNLWYRLNPNADIVPIALTDEDVERLFPNERIIETKQATIFFATAPIYDVSFYRVSDFDNIYGPDVLLAEYDEYTNDDFFFWQTDSMYKWHISIQYTDSEGDTHVFTYSLQDFSGMDPVGLDEIEGPDWNTDIEGEVFSEYY